MGRERAFFGLRRYFEDARAKQDGAFIAELLESSERRVGEGSVHYVKKEPPDEQYDDEHRRFWREATPLEMRDIEVSENKQAEDDLTTNELMKLTSEMMWCLEFHDIDEALLTGASVDPIKGPAGTWTPFAPELRLLMADAITREPEGGTMRLGNQPLELRWGSKAKSKRMPTPSPTGFLEVNTRTEETRVVRRASSGDFEAFNRRGRKVARGEWQW